MIKKIFLTVCIAFIGVNCLSFEIKNKNLNTTDSDLFVAIEQNNAGLVREMLKKDSSISRIEINTLSRQLTPLHWAISFAVDTSIVDVLLEFNTDVSHESEGMTPFELALLSEKKEIINLLEPYDIILRKNNMASPIWEYILKKDYISLKKHLSECGDASIRNIQGMRPMDIAINHLDLPLIQLLREFTHYSNVKSSSSYKIKKIGKQLKYEILRLDGIDLYKKLETKKSEINQLDAQGISPFMKSMKRGIPYGQVQAYLKAGANPNAVDKNGQKVWEHYGCESDEIKYKRKMFKAFISDYRKNPKMIYKENIYLDPVLLKGKKLSRLSNETYQKNQKEVIWQAIKNNDISTIDSWLKNGGNINIQNRDGETPIMKAVKKNSHEIIDFLIKNGADPRLKTYKNTTPIHKALEIYTLLENDNVLMNIELSKAIISKNKIIFTQKELNQHILTLCRNGASIRIIKHYLDLGGDPKVKDEKNQSLEALYATEYLPLKDERSIVKGIINEF